MAPPPIMGFHWKYIFEDLEKEESTAHQRERALEALVSLVDESEYTPGRNLEDDTESRDRIMSACLKEVKRRISSNETSSIANERIARLMWFCTNNNGNSTFIINNETLFRWILERICTEHDKEHETFSYLLFSIVLQSSASDRVSITIRYYTMLRQVIISFLTRDKTDVGGFMEIFDVSLSLAGIVASMPDLLYRWAMKTMDKDKHAVCGIIYVVLESALESPTTLQVLLGTGIMSHIAIHYSNLPGIYNLAETADFFRNILAKYPQFGQQFRGWTKDGLEGNPVADLGRSIPPKNPNRAADYVFYEEDGAI